MNIVLAGKPGSGKTTLFSRLTGRSVHSRPARAASVTSDARTALFEYGGLRFSVTDTVGVDSAAAMKEYSGTFSQADIILVLCDPANFDSSDTQIITQARKLGRPVVIAANKCESEAAEAKSGELFEWGLPVYPISALHGKGVGDLLYGLASGADRPSSGRSAPKGKVVFSCLVAGAPNAGKSTLLNSLLKEKRFMTSPVPGTTNEVTEELLETPRGSLRVKDSAGIFRRIKKDDLRVYNLKHLKDALASSDTVCFVVDGSKPVLQADLRIASLLKNKPCIIVFNKIDLIPLKERRRLKGNVSAIFPHLPDPPVMLVSALTGRNVLKIPDVLFSLYERIPLRLDGIDKVVKSAVLDARVPIFVLSARQTGYAPPVIFVKCRVKKGKLSGTIKRRIEKLIRKNYDLSGVPLLMKWKKLL